MPTYDITDSMINELFLKAMRSQDPATQVKVANASDLYIRDKIRESSFLRKILPPEPITKEECDRVPSREGGRPGIQKVIDLERDAEAVSLPFNAESDNEYIRGESVGIKFHKIASKEYEISEGDLLSYSMPITKIIEKNALMAVEKVEDKTFVDQLNGMVTHTGKQFDVVTTEPYLNARVLTTGYNLLESGDQLQCAAVLMNRSCWNDLMGNGIQEYGDKAYDVLFQGLTEESLHGKRVFITNKTDLVPHNEIWFFTAPEFLGKFYALTDTKLWIETRAEFLKYKIWEYIGVGLINTKSVAKINIKKAP